MKKILFTALICSLVSFSQSTAQTTYFPSNLKDASLEPLYQEAVFAWFNVEHSKFEALMSQVLEAEPDNFMALAHSAFHAYHVKKTDAFREYAARALKVGPPNDKVKGYADVLKARLETPKADISQEIATLIYGNMKVTEANLMQAILCLETGQPEIAHEVLFRTKNLAPEYAPTYNLLGYTAMDIGQMEQAGKAFKQYLSLMPQNPNAYDSMGDYYMAVKEYAKAKEAFEKAYQLDNRFTFSLDKAKEAEGMIK
ncbi:MAG: tetratricopeptide repeat protein [Saprospiraceae bacterium]|nr:tetratricopeptide repeat protein [Saprospiraceae bacterium]